MNFVYQNQLYNKIEAELIKTSIKELQSNGFTILRKYLNTDYPNKIKYELERIHSFLKEDSFNAIGNSLPIGEQGECLKDDITICHLPIYNKIFLQMALGGEHLIILNNILNDKHYQLISPELPNFILAQMNSRVGLNPLPWHNDVRLQISGQNTFSVQGFLSLDKLSKENGTLTLFPKTHFTGTYPDKNSINSSKTITLNLEPGDFVLFDSRLHHKTEKNLSNDSPWTILYTYRSWWVKPQFDFWRYFENNKTCIEHLNPVERSILGECSYSPYDLRESTSVRRALKNKY